MILQLKFTTFKKSITRNNVPPKYAPNQMPYIKIFQNFPRLKFYHWEPRPFLSQIRHSMNVKWFYRLQRMNIFNCPSFASRNRIFRLLFDTRELCTNNKSEYLDSFNDVQRTNVTLEKTIRPWPASKFAYILWLFGVL